MKISTRDMAVLRAMRVFKQLTALQIKTIAFADTSTTPRDRTLHRMMKQGLIIRLERRGPGGDKGGSGQFVYMLPKRLYRRAINHHTLAIVDCFLTAKELENQGLLTIEGYSAEPDCWVMAGEADVRPDLYMEMTRINGQNLHVWLEVDQGTESRKQLVGKLETYWKAYSAWKEPVFPKTIFVGIDDDRAKEIAWLISKLPPEHQLLFGVCTISTLQSLL